MNTLPPLSSLSGFEKIRDGGSFAAYFHNDAGHPYCLFLEIQMFEHSDLEREVVSYAKPVLIDCDPAKRPQNAGSKTYGVFSGPQAQISWAQARALMAITRNEKTRTARTEEWAECMNYIVMNDGAVPPAMRGIRRWQQPIMPS